MIKQNCYYLSLYYIALKGCRIFNFEFIHFNIIFADMTEKQSFVISLIAVTTVVTILMILSPDTKDLQCLARSTIIARGQDWVDKHVPYNHTGTHDGYRTDCSGFVSMGWQLTKPGLYTYTMHTVAHNISKTDLLAGDALNCDPYHIVLFAGWSDTGKTHYVAMQQIDPAHGTLKRVNPYPYYSNTTCFHPIRYNSVC